MNRMVRFVLLLVAAVSGSPASAQELLFRGSFEAEGRTPVVGAQAELRAADGTVKASTSTDAWGAFPAFAAAQLAAGDAIVVFGGSWGDAPFVGEFRSPVDSPAVAQTVGPVTTLVDAVANSSLVTDAPPGRLIHAINLLTARGLIDSDWRSGSAARIDDDLAAHIMAAGGMQTWVAALVIDLADGDLDRTWMVSFPHVHGGVAGIELGPSVSEWLRGDSVELTLEVERTLPAPAAGYGFSKQLGPDWVTVSPAGVLSANVPNDAPNGPGPLVIRVLNPDGGRFRDVTLSYQVLIGTMVAQATYGATGGTLWVPDNSIGIQVPDNAFSAPTIVEWVSYGEGDTATYRMRTNPRNRTFLLAPTLLTPGTRAPEGTQPVCTAVDGWGAGWFAKTCRGSVWAELRPLGGSPILPLGRLPGTPQHVLPDSQSYELPTRSQINWVLGARCNTDCAGRIPMLFVHGYTQLGLLGGGSGTWGDLPDLLHGQSVGANTLAAYQFRYRTNARFQDLAADLQVAIDAIYQETGQPVHIIAHSFGGLVARTYLQGVISGTPAIQPQPGNCTTSRHPKVASLVTIGTPHSGIAALPTTMHGRLLPLGRHGIAGGLMGACRQWTCWQAGSDFGSPLYYGGFAVLFGVEAQPGFIPARLSDFTTYPLPVPTLSLIGLMPSGNGFDGGDNLISYQGQRFSPRQSCPAGSCSSSAVVQPAITNIEGTQLGHCMYERVLGTVINNAAPLPGASSQRVQTLLQNYAHNGAVLPGGASPEVEVSSALVEGGDLKRAQHDTVHRLKDWLLRLREPDPAERVILVEVSGSGAVELDFAGTIQSCAGSCTYQAPAQVVPAQIRIRAVPAGGAFLGMTPSPCGQSLSWCDWRVGPYERIQAQFQTGGQGLVRVSIGGAGRVRVNPGNLLCAGNCNFYFAPLTSVALSAESTGGSFNGWSGTCFGSNSSCSVTAQASQPRIVGAAFGTPAPVSARPLNDTGQNWCANNTTGNLNCPQAGFPDQDGDHGRDAHARAGQLSKIGGGEAGFDYTKISNSGNPLPASAALGSGPNDWACTRDNVTGLIWEVKVNNASHLRHMNHTYTWYSTDAGINGGVPGTLGTAPTCNSTLAQCNTQAFAAAVNTQGLCGHGDWRLPSSEELQGIAHYGRSEPALDPLYFANAAIMGGASLAWTGRNVAFNAFGAWAFFLRFGGTFVNFKSSPIGAWLVRGPQ
ncbi:MAG: DUF1566 domain-containing protein [Burkholderiales bacterium]